MRDTSTQLEWSIVNTEDRSTDLSSLPQDSSLLDSILKLIKSIQESNANRSCVVTTSNQIELIAKELKTNCIQLPPYIETYANVYSEYKEWLNTNEKSPKDPQTLTELHDALGIKEEEEEEVKETLENIVKIASKLLDNGHLFQAKDKNSVVKDIVVGVSGKTEKRRVLEPSSPVPFQELRTKLVGGISNEVGNLNSNEGGSGVVSVRRDLNNLDDKVNLGTIRGQFVVRLRGLPWQITEEDIEKFFSGLVIVPYGIYFIRDSSGRPMGEGFVRFETQSDFEEAIKRHKHFIGKRYIEVFSSSMDEWNKAGANYVNKPSSYRDRSEPRYDSRSKPKDYPSGGSYVIRMRGLPYSVKIEDVLDFFRGIDIRENQVYLLLNHNGRITGDGYVCVNSARQAERAMSFHNSRIAQRYIELFKSDEKELDSVLARSDYMRPRDYSSRSRDRERGRYSPYREPERSRPYSSHRDYDYRGYPPSMPPRAPPTHTSPPSYPPTPINFALRLRGLPFSVTNRDIEEFFDGCEIQRDGIHLVRNHQGKLTGEAYVEFHSENDKRMALRKQNSRIGTRYIELFHATEDELARYVPPYSKSRYGTAGVPEIDPGLVRMLQGGVGQRSYDPPPPHPYPPQYPDPYGQPPRYGYSPNAQVYPPPVPSTYPSAPRSYQEPSVVIRGLNAHVTVADIQRYFEGYQFNPDSIQVVSNMERTVFEATVQFRSLGEAHRALKEKERGMIGPCAIKLYDQ